MKQDDWKDYACSELANIAYKQDKLSTKETAMVFAFLCYQFCLCYEELDNQVISTKWITEDLNMTKYRVRKCTNELKQLGLIKRTSVGCPGGEIYTEVGMVDCWDPHPPLNGFGLTEKATTTNTFKEASEYTRKAFQNWCEALREDTEWGF